MKYFNTNDQQRLQATVSAPTRLELFQVQYTKSKSDPSPLYSLEFQTPEQHPLLRALSGERPRIAGTLATANNSADFVLSFTVSKSTYLTSKPLPPSDMRACKEPLFSFGPIKMHHARSESALKDSVQSLIACAAQIAYVKEKLLFIKPGGAYAEQAVLNLSKEFSLVSLPDQPGWLMPPMSRTLDEYVDQ